MAKSPVSSEAFEAVFRPTHSFFSLLTACLGKAGQALLFNPCSVGCGHGSGSLWVQVGTLWCSLAVPRSEARVGLPMQLPGQLCCAAAET